MTNRDVSLITAYELESTIPGYDAGWLMPSAQNAPTQVGNLAADPAAENPGFWSQLGSGISRAAVNISDGVRSFLADTGRGVGDVGSGVGRGLGGIGEGIGGGVSSVGEGAGRGLGDGVGGIGAGLKWGLIIGIPIVAVGGVLYVRGLK